MGIISRIKNFYDNLSFNREKDRSLLISEFKEVGSSYYKITDWVTMNKPSAFAKEVDAIKEGIKTISYLEKEYLGTSNIDSLWEEFFIAINEVELSLMDRTNAHLDMRRIVLKIKNDGLVPATEIFVEKIKQEI